MRVARWRTARFVAPLLLCAGGLWSCGAPEGERRGGGDDGASADAAERLERDHVLTLDPERPRTTGVDSAAMAGALAMADSLSRLRCLLVARHGETLVERCASGFDAGRFANVKSVSKSVISALVGLAIADDYIHDVDQTILPLFASRLEAEPDPRKTWITVGHLLSMQSGLERTSGGNYGAWVRSSNWVDDAIRRPMVAEPGGRMLYSTGNSHLLSAILTRVTDRSTLAYARDRLGEPLGIRIPPWVTDPQGIYFGGNDMRLSPRAMLRFGELYRNGGRHDGRQVVPESWVRTSLEPRTRSPWSGDRYGYGWFLSEAAGYRMFYAWGYGGQFIFVVPDLELTVVTTSDPYAPRGGPHLRAIHAMLEEWIVPAAERGRDGS